MGLPGDKLIRLILTLPVANVVFKGLSLLLFRSTLPRIISSLFSKIVVDNVLTWKAVPGAHTSSQVLVHLSCPRSAVGGFSLLCRTDSLMEIDKLKLSKMI